MTTKSSWFREKFPGDGPRGEHADDHELIAADANRLADRIDARFLEQQLIRAVAEHGDIVAVLDFHSAEKPSELHRDARAFGVTLARAEHDHRPCFLIPVLDPPVHVLSGPEADLNVDELEVVACS